MHKTNVHITVACGDLLKWRGKLSEFGIFWVDIFFNISMNLFWPFKATN